MADMVQVDGRDIEITHPDKLLYPDAAITKRRVVEYYRRIAERMLPHVRGRPVSLQRFPGGLREDGFYQKEIPDSFPPWIQRVEIDKRGGGTHTQLTIENAATLVFLANQDVLTPHVWLSRRDRLEQPDRMIVDLDPPGRDGAGEGAFTPVRNTARELCSLLGELGLVPFVMTTGSRGLHVTVPLDGDGGAADFDAVRSFARRVAGLLAARHPEELTTETRKAKRQGRLFLDYLRNAYGQTGVAPYALRARPGAPVAAPLAVDELDRGDLSSTRYRLNSLFRRLAQKDDPWADIDSHARGLAEAEERLTAMEDGESA